MKIGPKTPAERAASSAPEPESTHSDAAPDTFEPSASSALSRASKPNELRAAQIMDALKEDTPDLQFIVDLADQGAALPKKLDTVDKPGATHKTALLWAAETGKLNAIKTLASAGARVNQTANDLSALDLAVMGRHVHVINTLIDLGANINRQDRNGQTALHWASLNGDPELTRALLQAGADRNLQDGRGKRALELAANPETRNVFKGRPI